MDGDRQVEVRTFLCLSNIHGRLSAAKSDVGLSVFLSFASEAAGAVQEAADWVWRETGEEGGSRGQRLCPHHCPLKASAGAGSQG